MTQTEYKAIRKERQEAVSKNRSLRMRGLPLVAVPEIPELPMIPFAYTLDGTYEGRLSDASECPSGCVVRYEKARW